MLETYRFHAGQFSVNLAEITFKGEDVKTFLHSQSTYNIQNISLNQFQLISFLDPQGRLDFYGWLLFDDFGYRLLIPKALIEMALSRLNKFLISEDVEISTPEFKKVWFSCGPNIKNYIDEKSFSGILFDDQFYITNDQIDYVPIISDEEIELWRGLSGWPSFHGKDIKHELLNNLRLYDLSLVPNKGCYPGQETVSKIATRRGAAYGPVLIELSKPLPEGEIENFGKKIGSVYSAYSWCGKIYQAASILRDFRVENLKISLSGQEGIIHYYPLIKGDIESKSKEIYFDGINHFKNDQLTEAEEKLRLAIKLDPSFGDAYESLGVMLGRQERFQEAIDLMEKLTQVDPKSVLAHTNMSLYLMRMGKIAEAEEQKSLATIKSFQRFGDEAKNKEAELDLKKKKEEEWEKRESMFVQVLEIDPTDTLAHYGLGSIAVEKGEWSKAREHLEQVLKEDPKYSIAYLALGKALKGLGLVAEAKSIWEEGIRVAAAKGDLMPANQMQQELNS